MILNVHVIPNEILEWCYMVSGWYDTSYDMDINMIHHWYDINTIWCGNIYNNYLTLSRQEIHWATHRNSLIQEYDGKASLP